MALGTLVRNPRPARRTSGWPFDRLVDDLWSGFGLAPVAFPTGGPLASAHGDFAPRFDAVELENEYRVTAEIPGVDPKDVEVAIEDGVLVIKGQRHYDDENESDSGVQRVSERGRFERRLRFPGDVAESEVTATHKHGVLTVVLPKPAAVQPELRSIPVETA